MSTIVELQSKDNGESWKLLREYPIKEPPIRSTIDVMGLPPIPVTLLTSRNGKAILEPSEYFR